MVDKARSHRVLDLEDKDMADQDAKRLAAFVLPVRVDGQTLRQVRFVTSTR